MGNLIKYCIVLYHPDNAAINSQWFPTLLAIIFLLFGGVFNLYCEYFQKCVRHCLLER